MSGDPRTQQSNRKCPECGNYLFYVECYSEPSDDEYFCKVCPSKIESLESQLAAVTAERDEYKHWRETACKAADKAEADRDKYLALLGEVYGILDAAPELNMANYDEDQVSALNDAMVDAFLAIRTGRTQPYTCQGCADRDAVLDEIDKKTKAEADAYAACDIADTVAFDRGYILACGKVHKLLAKRPNADEGGG